MASFSDFFRHLPKGASEHMLRTIFIGAFVFLIGGFLLFVLLTVPGTAPRDGGTFTEGLVWEVQTLNPLYASLNPVDADISRLVFSWLTKFSLEKQRMDFDLAQSLDVSEDRKTYTFHLRKGVLWHDGAPFTADDVLFTYRDVIQNEGFDSPYLKSQWQNIKIEKEDDWTVRFILPKEDAFFMRNVSLGLLPKHVLENVSVKEIRQHFFSRKPIGTGPFALKTLLDNTVVLQRFDGYYGFRSHLEEITFRIFRDERDVFTQSSADAFLNVPSPYAKDLERLGYSLHYYHLPQYVALFFHVKNELLREKVLRKMIETQLDISDLMKGISSVQLVNSPVFLVNENLPKKETKDQKDALTAFLKKQGYRFLTKKDLQNQQQGQTQFMFKEVKFQNEVLEKRLSFRLATIDAGDYVTIAYRIKSQLEKTGMFIDVLVYEPSQMKTVLANRDYDMLLFGQNLWTDLDFYPFWHSSQTEWGQNLSDFSSLGLDYVVSAIRSERNEEKHRKLLQQLEKTLLDEAPLVPLYTPLMVYASRDDVYGILYDAWRSLPDRFNNVEHWYRFTERVWRWEASSQTQETGCLTTDTGASAEACHVDPGENQTVSGAKSAW